MQLFPVLQRQAVLIRPEGGLKRRAACDPVGQMPDANRVAVRIVVAFDHLKIAEHSDPGAGHLRLQHRNRRARNRPGLSTPALPAHPSGARQIGRRGGQRIRRVLGPDIAAAVAGEIHRIGQIGCRDELRMSHGPGPAAGHVRRRRVTFLNDLQRRNQLLFKERTAPPVIGQCGRCRDHGHIAPPRTVTAFQPPDGHDNLFIDAVFRLDLRQGACVTYQHLFAGADPLVRGGNGQIILERAFEFHLIAVPLDHARQVTRPLKGAVDRGLRNALRRGAALEPGHPGIPSRIRHRLHARGRLPRWCPSA